LDVLTITGTTPLPGSVVNVICVLVLEFIVQLLVPFIMTATEVPVKFVPIIVTLIPPVSGPVSGAMLVIVGSGPDVMALVPVPKPNGFTKIFSPLSIVHMSQNKGLVLKEKTDVSVPT
jgi:hypothetical protein